jgi:hypothetical protein
MTARPPPQKRKVVCLYDSASAAANSRHFEDLLESRESALRSTNYIAVSKDTPIQSAKRNFPSLHSTTLNRIGYHAPYPHRSHSCQNLLDDSRD